jgi:hypothetical protein
MATAGRSVVVAGTDGAACSAVAACAAVTAVAAVAAAAAVAAGAALAERLMKSPLNTIAMIALVSSSARAGRLLLELFLFCPRPGGPRVPEWSE